MSRPARGTWMLLLVASTILMITMGSRQTIGLFIAPLNAATGLGIVAISLAAAINQFTWGLSQPVFGALADRFGPLSVLLVGGLLLAAGLALVPLVHTEVQLIIVLGLLMAVGSGAGSFSILIGSVLQRLPAERRSFAAGLLNAGGSLGQFVFAPVLQVIITGFGWVTALLTMAVFCLATVPLAWPLRGPASTRAPAARTEALRSADAPGSAQTMRAQMRVAWRDTSYWCLHLGFFTCGFHVAFLVTHLPGQVHLCGLDPLVSANSLALIGLANIVGSLTVGWLGTRRRMKLLLFAVYFTRAVIILVFMAAPKTALTFYVFAVALGLTWLATVPPTAGLVGKLFGVRYLATLFGLTLFSHQIGGFFGTWLGGIAVSRFGDYTWMWYADAGLALFAALINLPIREARVLRALPA
jgi:MFS family permease